MPCSVKCRCGKNEKFFQFLNQGDISHFECDECPPESQVVASASFSVEVEMNEGETQEQVEERVAQEVLSQVPDFTPEKPKEETAAQRKKREKAEKKAREAAEKAAKEQKPPQA